MVSQGQASKLKKNVGLRSLNGVSERGNEVGLLVIMQIVEQLMSWSKKVTVKFSIKLFYPLNKIETFLQITNLLKR